MRGKLVQEGIGVHLRVAPSSIQFRLRGILREVEQVNNGPASADWPQSSDRE
jgi:hypothetical protein